MSSESAPSITFCTVVESGPLERQVVMLAESLRRFGGRFANAPFIAVRPRFGGALESPTLKSFKAHNVQLLDIRPNNPYAWYSFLNKPLTLMEVDKRATTKLIAWLDGDVLVARPPEELELSPECDFVAVAPDKNIGTAGPDDPNEFYWREMCRIAEVDLEKLPWITTEREKVRIRMYFNSGVFSFPRGIGFPRTYYELTKKLLDEKIAGQQSKLFFHEQSALGLAVQKMGLRWRALSFDYNYSAGQKVDHHYVPAELKSSRLIHYHSALYASYWSKFIEYLKTEKPDLHDWLAPRGPLTADLPITSRVVNWMTKKVRLRQSNQHLSQCRIV